MNAISHMSGRLRQRHREHGVATIEFAICAPLLLFLMLGVAEVGRLLFQYNALTKSVRDGARYVVRNAVNPAGLVTLSPARRDQTRNLVVTGNTAGSGAALLPDLTVEDVSVTILMQDGVNTGFISVTATYDYQPMLGDYLPTFGLGDPIDMSISLPATVVMRGL